MLQRLPAMFVHYCLSAQCCAASYCRTEKSEAFQPTSEKLERIPIDILE